MNYNISYRIIDNSTGKVLFKNSNTSCFAEFLTIYKSPVKFEKGKSIQVYRALDTFVLNDIEIEKYLKLLNKDGYKVSTNIIKKSEMLNDNYSQHQYFSDENLEFTLSFDDYMSKQHLKLALYLVRYSFEKQSHVLIRDVLKFIDNNPECNILEAVRIVLGYSNTFYETGHGIFTTGAKTAPITRSIYNSIFDNSKYGGFELQDLYIKIQTVGNDLTSKSSYKKHLDHFKVKLDEI